MRVGDADNGNGVCEQLRRDNLMPGVQPAREKNAGLSQELVPCCWARPGEKCIQAGGALAE